MLASSVTMHRAVDGSHVYQLLRDPHQDSISNDKAETTGQRSIPWGLQGHRNICEPLPDGVHLHIQRAPAQHARQLRALPASAAQIAAVGRRITGLLHFLCAELQVCHLQT